MFGIGFPEMLIILVLIVLVVGPEQLPDVARKGVAFFREARGHLAQIRAEVEKQTEPLRDPLQSIRDDIDRSSIDQGKDAAFADGDESSTNREVF